MWFTYLLLNLICCCYFQVVKLQAAIKYGEEDLPGAKVTEV